MDQCSDTVRVSGEMKGRESIGDMSEGTTKVGFAKLGKRGETIGIRGGKPVGHTSIRE